MLSFNALVLVSVAYVAFLFLVAFAAERQAARGRARWIRSPLIYTLSLSIYCTAWTFYGAVGYAARSGLEYVTIYLGPTLVLIGWWWVLRRLVRIGKAQRITSIADLISSRFGKSTLLGVIVTLLAVVGTTPYIALQLQSVTQSLSVFAADSGGIWGAGEVYSAGLWVAAGLTLFTIVFGTRNLDVNERHHGVVMAIAVEAVVKLFALLAVGIFVVWGIGDGLADMARRIDESQIATWSTPGGKWFGTTFLAAAAFLTLPRMFHVMVVENADERHVATASWAFPLYLLLMSLFVVPIAVTGLGMLPEGSNPDLFVLTLPLSEGREGLAIFAFLGGFSSATSMVIVAAIAVSTMVSNHVVVPIWLNASGQGALVAGDVRGVVLLSRRISIAAVLILGYAYFRLSGGGTALAAIGLVSFVGLSQVLPAMIGGIFWRGATRAGAAAGLITGFVVWGYCLFLPSFGPGSYISDAVLAQGPWGLGWLRPQALFGIDGLDPVMHALMWSMLANTTAFFVGSILSFPTPLERLQGAQFVNVFDRGTGLQRWRNTVLDTEDLLVMAQRIIGASEAQRIFRLEAQRQGKSGYLPDAAPEFLDLLERELAGSVGAATAHAMIAQITGGAAVSVEDLIAVADEAAQIMEYSNRLEAKSAEQERTARQLRDANEKLTQLSIQKDAFLGQISHELRTPMTSIRAFSDILKSEGLSAEDQGRYAGIIHDEAIRLTRLLDDLLDLNVLENGQVKLHRQTGVLRDLIDRAVSAGIGHEAAIAIDRQREDEAVELDTDLDRLSQVFINLISNAQKYCDAKTPRLKIRAAERDGLLVVDFIDNGTEISRENQEMIFEKFSRLSDQAAAGGAGLGLAICREIMVNLGGSITYLPGQGGVAFRVSLPAARAMAAQ